MSQPVRFGLNVDPNTGGLPIAERIAAIADTNRLEYVGVQDHPYNSGFVDTLTQITWLDSPDPALITPTLAETARIAEQAGVSSFTVMDHYFQMERVASVDEPMLEGYTALGYLAATTERMTLGLLVTGVMYRYPGLLAKIVTILGRALFRPPFAQSIRWITRSAQSRVPSTNSALR